MAIDWAIEHSGSVLLAIQLIVATDCQKLIYLNSNATRKPKIARRTEVIQEYQFIVRHRSGTKMVHADVQSRAPVGDPINTWTEVLDQRTVLNAMTEEEHG